jgi:hypothetical protein
LLKGNDIASAAILVFKSDLSKFYWTCGGLMRNGVAGRCATKGPPLLDQKKLISAIEDDLQTCRESGRFDSPEQDKMRNNVEFSALTTHLMWTESVGDNQAELEHIVHSLEANPFLRGYQSWRKRCEII